MGVLATDATNVRRQFSDRLFKLRRYRQKFAGAVVEDGSQFSPECAVFLLPKIEWEHTVPSAKQQLRSNSGAFAPRHARHGVERNRQLVGLHAAQHLQTHQAFCKKNGMTAIDGNRVEGL